jgi:hypothetical protein
MLDTPFRRSSEGPPSLADHQQVRTQVWTFVRGEERLELSREATGTGITLIIVSTDGPRTIHFSTHKRLVQFQADMETLLLRTGWSFSEFSPEHRSGTERRGFPRFADRRRWWTDSVRLFARRNERSVGS